MEPIALFEKVVLASNRGNGLLGCEKNGRMLKFLGLSTILEQNAPVDHTVYACSEGRWSVLLKKEVESYGSCRIAVGVKIVDCSESLSIAKRSERGRCRVFLSLQEGKELKRKLILLTQTTVWSIRR